MRKLEKSFYFNEHLTRIFLRFRSEKLFYFLRMWAKITFGTLIV